MLDNVRLLRDRQREEFENQNLDFPFWQGKELTLKNIEHALCDYYKYKRVLLGGYKRVRKHPQCVQK